MAWVLLGVAIASEVAGTLALRASEGMTRWGPSAVVVIGYGVAFVLLAQALKTMNVGPAYAIWSGLGTAGAAAGGYLIFAERLGPLSLAGIALIMAGVVVTSLGGASHG